MYNMLVFITRKFIQTIYFKDNKGVSISIDGNLKVALESDPDFSRLVDSIEETFNVDDLSEAEISAVIVNCGAKNIYVDKLYRIFSCVASHSVINAENIIPFITKELYSLDKNKEFSVLDSYYSLKIQNKIVTCSPIEKSKSAETLTPETFGILFKLNVSNNLFNNEEDSKKDLTIQKLNKTISRYKEDIKKLTNEIKDNNKELSKNKGSQNSIDEISKYIECISKRELISFRLTDKDFYYPEKFSFAYSYEKANSSYNSVPSTKVLPITIQHNVKNGALIKEGELIAECKIFLTEFNKNKKGEYKTTFGKRSDFIKKEIVATKSGKIFFFNYKIPYLRCFSYICSRNKCLITTNDFLLGVIVEESDNSTSREILKWGKIKHQSSCPSHLNTVPCRSCHRFSSNNFCNEQYEKELLGLKEISFVEKKVIVSKIKGN